jgi:hypothetical protein
MPQAVKSDIHFPSDDAALQREILRERRAVFREEAQRARRMMADRELWTREQAAVRAAEARRMRRITAGWLCLLLVGLGLAVPLLPDIVEWVQGISWYPKVSD